MDIPSILSTEFGIKREYACNIIALLNDGCTVPFIARYRKEAHGNCNDQVIRAFADRLKYLKNLEKSKEKVLRLIGEQSELTLDLRRKIENAETLSSLQDIYRPFKRARRTKSIIAEEEGLRPLAETILAQRDERDLSTIAQGFVNEKVKDTGVALCGAKDIIVSIISSDIEVRKKLRGFIFASSVLTTSLKPGENYLTYKTYEKYREDVQKIPAYRILAVNRGEKEKCLKVKIIVDDDKCLGIISSCILREDGNFRSFLEGSIRDAFHKFLLPSLAKEVRSYLTSKAEDQAIKTFKLNLRPLLMAPPLKNKVILGIDPAYRTGCKIAVIDTNGNVLDTAVIYPTPPNSQIEKSEEVVLGLILKYKVEAISIGNGTASKETEIFVRNLLKKVDKGITCSVVSEAGASVYSVSPLAVDEFPDYDVSLRSAVSIARRLQDPLSELVKIDVKSLGVGEYQHDMPQKRLLRALNGVVEDCVNAVGVDLNTASYKLLEYVSGLNISIAKNIVNFRKENGNFKKRSDLLKVKNLGSKVFKQASGFLRIPGGEDILDNTGIHPESYEATKKLLTMFNFTKKDVKNGAISNLKDLVNNMGKEIVAKKCNIGVMTLEDIIKELLKPGRDIRDSYTPKLIADINDIRDLKVGMVMTGVVRNVVDFGAFVDIGVHQDGLVHISEISNEYVKHPSDKLAVGDIVKVKIIGVDIEKKRIALSMKNLPN